MFLKWFSSAQQVLALDPEEMGAALLTMMQEAMHQDEARVSQGSMRIYTQNRHNVPLLDALLSPLEQLTQRDQTASWPYASVEEVRFVAMEGWSWLLAAGLLMPAPQGSGHVITRRGRQLRSEEDVWRYREDGVLPVGLLHPRIAHEVKSLFSREHYDTAVFHAFKELEVLLRQAVQGAAHHTGKEVVKAAFNPTSGLLRNTGPEVPESERVAKFALFDGAIGAFKNPGSHRRVELGRADGTRLVLFASHLLYLVDERQRAVAAG